MVVRLKTPHEKQRAFIESKAKRKIVRAGRRSGKTTGASIKAVDDFLDGHRILYAVPTQEQVDRFWFECKIALKEPIEAGIYYKNETKHIIELPGTEQRIRAKTAWNADSLRGDYADELILDEYQQMDEDAWSLVGAPMMLDTDGNTTFIYTQKRGKHHSKELFKKAKEDQSGRWETFVFSSHDNPHLSQEALDEITLDMTTIAYRAEILAEDIEDDPMALWRRQEMIEDHRVTSHPALVRVIVGVDPPGGATECGIIVGALGKDGDGYIIEDRSLKASPAKWGSEVLTAYHHNEADRIVGEKNYGGDMVENTIRRLEGGELVSYKDVHATRGKAVRAEPVAALYEQGRIHHVGEFPDLEDELCTWVPGVSKWSPNRLDALVWVITEIIPAIRARSLPETQPIQESKFLEEPVGEKSRWKRY